MTRDIPVSAALAAELLARKAHYEAAMQWALLAADVVIANVNVTAVSPDARVLTIEVPE